MLNAAMVLMILAGIFGLPAAVCSGACSSIGSMAEADGYGSFWFWDFLMYASLLASVGAIVLGAMVKKIAKKTSVSLAVAFSVIFGMLLLQGNILGLLSSLMLLVAAVMVYVAPPEQFRGVTRVETA